MKLVNENLERLQALVEYPTQQYKESQSIQGFGNKIYNVTKPCLVTTLF